MRKIERKAERNRERKRKADRKKMSNCMKKQLHVKMKKDVKNVATDRNKWTRKKTVIS